jgi:tetratricopeptide (TPR) repeat protein
MLRSLCHAASALVFASASAAAQDARALVARTDSLLGRLDVAAARQSIEAAYRTAPKDYDVLWRLSRVHVLAGDASAVKSEQDKLYKSAQAYADQAIKGNPNGAEGYVRRAAAAGKVALFKGVLDAADLVESVKADAEKAIALNNNGPMTTAAAHYILGRTHLKLTETPRPLRMPLGLGWGSLTDATAQLKKATELRPGFIMYQLEYARALIKGGQGAQARPLLTAIATLPALEPGDEERRKEAVELLRE